MRGQVRQAGDLRIHRYPQVRVGLVHEPEAAEHDRQGERAHRQRQPQLAPARLAGRGDLNGGNFSTDGHLFVIFMAYATGLFFVRFE